MEKINWKELIETKNNAFDCETEDIANIFLRNVHDLGYKWRSGLSVIDTNYWVEHKSQTCYDFRTKGNYHGCGFGNLSWYLLQGFNVINVRDLLGNRKPFKLKRK